MVPQPMNDEVQGVIERVTFHNSDTGFAVLRVQVKGNRDPITVVGTTVSASAGEHLEATGRWVVDRDHGRQFKAEQIRTSHPSTPAGIERFLASGAIRSIGPKLAARIVSLYQQQTLEILDQHPDMLLHVRGIGHERLERIRKSWNEQREVRKIMVFLADHGISTARALRIYRTYGHEAISLIKSNPYRLADDVRGIGFKTADELARRLGIDRNSPYRARAALHYTLHELAGAGHCGYPEAEVIAQTVKLTEIDTTIVERAVQSVVDDRSVVREAIEGDSWLYLAALHRAEVGLAQALHRLLQSRNHPLPAIDVERAIAWVEGKLSIQLAAGQKEAIRQACQQKVLVITGGPGVGKTTLVRSILEIFSAKKLTCVLTAPTGRAAKRLAETTGRTAKTLHRLLEFEPQTGGFKRDQQRPLHGDLFVLDECSMIDVALGHQFLRAVPESACVVFVGDVDQLPSVGPGTVLADVIRSDVVPVVRLTEVFRQARESQIISAAYAIHEGEVPRAGGVEGLSDFYLIEAEEPDAIQDLIVRLVTQRVPARFGLDPLTEIQVLSPMNRTALGTRHLNEVLQAALNPPGDQSEVQRFGWTFRAGDRVIQTENDYDRDVFNGDLGIIETLNRVEQRAVVRFEDRAIEYDFGDLDALALAYVLSIHKSQGSEFPCVIIPVHTQHFVMLQRNLLYTAVTRGKRLVILVGSKRALGMAVRREDTSRRYTALGERLKKVED